MISSTSSGQGDLVKLFKNAFLLIDQNSIHSEPKSAAYAFHPRGAQKFHLSDCETFLERVQVKVIFPLSERYGPVVYPHQHLRLQLAAGSLHEPARVELSALEAPRLHEIRRGAVRGERRVV
eukprot:7132958-Pyramimonas_sp.AAC.1